MASICCRVYEEVVVPCLCRPHIRSDNKLTPTERERVSDTFALVWQLLMESFEYPCIPKERMAAMTTEALFRIREMISSSYKLSKHHNAVK